MLNENDERYTGVRAMPILAMTIVKHDRLMGTEWLMGDEISTKEFRQYIQVMDLDKDNLFSN